MHEVEIAKRVFERLESKDYKSARELLADGFEFSGSFPKPLDAEGWMGMHKRLGAAFSDMAFNLEDLRLEDSKVYCSSMITCTHTGVLDIPEMGVEMIPATGKAISLPRERVEVEVKDGKISHLRVSASPGGGVEGMLSQLGVKIPA
jgi:predicted ester cyclase